AATQLVRMTSADVATALFVVDLPDLGGATRLRNAGISVTSLLSFEGE
ncbi:MAG: adenine phosphoribosyltransferase, partial [Citromicrobium sp.]|nr:adenine phosphoribosyltransferase [Citromicrobium sp.]